MCDSFLPTLRHSRNGFQGFGIFHHETFEEITQDIIFGNPARFVGIQRTGIRPVPDS